MTKLTSFDVLIIYSENLAVSAADPSAVLPFPQSSRRQAYNIVYSYFLEVCQKLDLTAAFSTSADIVGPGFCRCFWIFKNQQWHKINSPCFSSLIFDKFSPTTAGIQSRRRLLFSSSEIKPFNDPELFDLFFDKQKTYEKLSAYSVPTISVKNTTLFGLASTCEILAKLIKCHPDLGDFSQNLVMKDRFGAGGRHVYKIKAGRLRRMRSIILKHPDISFIIQPFAKFNLGFRHNHRLARTDIRFVYLGGKIIQSYIRVARLADFRCNEHRGGLLTYLPLSKIPSSLITKSNLIAEIINKKSSFFSLDFIVSNNGNSYLLEGNTGPGLDWNTSLSQNEIESKKLIHLVVEEIAQRTKPQNYSTKVKAYPLLFPRPVLPIRCI